MNRKFLLVVLFIFLVGMLDVYAVESFDDWIIVNNEENGLYDSNDGDTSGLGGLFDYSFLDNDVDEVSDSGDLTNTDLEQIIPDAGFRKCIIDHAKEGTGTRDSIFADDSTYSVKYIKNGEKIENFTVADLSKVRAIYCDDYGINDLTGLDKLTNLKILSLSNNPITSLSVSNPNLTYLYIRDTKIKYSDLSIASSLNSKIEVLDFGGLNLSTSNFNDIIEKYANLKFLFVDNSNDVSGNINISNLSNLRGLLINKTSISGISGIDNLELLNVANTNIKSLDMSNNSKLKYLNIGGDAIGSLDLSKAAGLQILYANSSNLSSLKLSDSASLYRFDISYNPLLSNNIQKWVNQSSNLVDFMSDANKLTSLDLSGCTKLRLLSLYNNLLSSLKLPNTDTLLSLNLSVNGISSLDLSKYTNLKNLYASSLNKLMSIDLSKNTKLVDFNGGLSGYSNSLDLSKNTLLEYITVNADYAKNINFNSFSNLKQVYSVDYNVIPVYGSSYPTSSLLKVVPSNVKLNSYKLYDGFGGNNPLSDATTITSDGEVYTNVRVHSDDIVNSSVNKSGITQKFDGYYVVKFVKLSSDKYVIDDNKNVIDVGGDSNDTIIKNLKLTWNDNVSATIDGNKLVVKYDGVKLKEYTLQRVINPKTGNMFIFGVIFLLVVSICCFLVIRKSVDVNKI